jgi:4-amino-4-deoxy-L-arabinose transferase-like glycosyltransferase
VCSLVRAVRESIAARSSFELFFGLWAILPVIFFSFSQSKLPGYILPALLPMAIIAAEYLWRRQNEGDEPPFWMAALHALVGGSVLAGALLSIYFILRIPLAPLAIFIAVFAGIVIFSGMLVAVYARGIRTIRLATLVPVVLAVAFILKMASPAIDVKNSQRAVAQKVAAIAPAAMPVAVAYVPRVVEYGLNFYRNQPINNYERGEVPIGEHVVVARPGAAEVITAFAKGREVTDAGGFAPQNLEFYVVGGKQ